MKTTTAADLGYTRKVLLLDDDGNTLAILSRRLQEHGMEVVTCREIEAAEPILDHTRVDAVLRRPPVPHRRGTLGHGATEKSGRIS